MLDRIDLRDELKARAWHALRFVEKRLRDPYINQVRLDVGEFTIHKRRYSMNITTKMEGLEIVVFKQGYVDNGIVVNPVPAMYLLRLLRREQILDDLAAI